MKREYMILDDSQLSADDWTDEINDTLLPEYWWLNDWKKATAVVHHQRIGRQKVLVLEQFLVGLGAGCAIHPHYQMRFRDCRQRSPAMRAIFNFFCAHYRDVTQPQLNGDQVTETGVAARQDLARKAKKKAAEGKAVQP